MNKFSQLEKFAIAYSFVTRLNFLNSKDFSHALSLLCENISLPCFSQNCKIIDENNLSQTHTNNLVFISDEKYNIHGLFLTDSFLDRLGYANNNEPCFNFLCISPIFVDSISIFNHSRLVFDDFNGFYYTNNLNNTDFLLISQSLNLKPEQVLTLKNCNPISEDVLYSVINKISPILGYNPNEIFNKFLSRNNSFFVSSKSTKLCKVSLVNMATKLVGTPILKNKDLQTFDCASFLTYLFMSTCGINIASNGIGNSLTGKIMTSSVGKNFLIDENVTVEKKAKFILKNAQVGDILLFHRQSKNATSTPPDNWYPGHVGIYVGDGKYIDARHRRGNVAIVDITLDDYMDCFVGIKSILGKEPVSKEINKQLI